MAGASYCVRVHHWLRWSPQAYADVLTHNRRSRAGRRLRPARSRLVGDAGRRFLLVAVHVALAGALVALGSSLSGFFSLHEPDPFTRAASLSLFQPEPLRYDLWYQADLNHLTALARRPLSEGQALLRAERNRLDRELRQLDSTGAYVDPRGFRVYDPAVTGRLHALALARRNRQDLLSGASPESLPGPEAIFQVGGYRLYRTLTRKFAPREEVVRALRGLRLPDAPFAGYRVYLLPGSLGNVSGVGGPGYSLLGAEPLTARLVEHQAASTVTHEFGHHLSLSRMGGHLSESPGQWQRFLTLRRIPGWREDGAVNTEAWARSPEEALAEDVRVLFGTAEAASLPYDAAYGDPRRDPSLRRAEAEFLRELAARKALRPPDHSPAPWLDDLGAGRLDLAQRQFFLALLALTAFAGVALVRRSVRAVRCDLKTVTTFPKP